MYVALLSEPAKSMGQIRKGNGGVGGGGGVGKEGDGYLECREEEVGFYFGRRFRLGLFAWGATMFC